MIKQLVEFHFNGTKEEYEVALSKIEDILSNAGIEFMPKEESIEEEG